MNNPYLIFKDITPSDRKTRVVHVRSRKSGSLLGLIRWYGAWRQYAFFPKNNTIWNSECLDSVNDYIRGLMEERRG